jgi:hypothetical protein
VKATESSSDLNLSVNSVVSLSITNCDASDASSVVLSIDPTNAGVFKSACQNIAVAANTPGYSLSIKSSSTDLIYQNPTTLNPKPIVPSTTTGTITAPATLPNDSWGFAVEKQAGMTSNFDTTYTINNINNKYALLPTTDQTIYQTDKALGETPAPLSDFMAFYGAKLTLATVAGEYKTTITYSAIGETVPCQWDNSISFDDLNCMPTMQNFTTAECAIMEIYTNNGDNNKLITLTDIRNNQDYLVGKLADGNCWMLNNLKLGSLTNDITLTPADSNITANWVLPRVNANTSHLDGVPSPYALLSNDSLYVPGLPNSEETDINSSNFAGYYYNWCTTTAGTPETTCTISSVLPTDATQDICPAGWRIPIGVEDDLSKNEFSQLSAKMAGFADSQDPDYLNFYETFYSNFLYDGPFRGVLAGFYNPGDYLQGGSGTVWSSTHHQDISYLASALHFYDGLVWPAFGSGPRFNNISVRCLLK